MDLKDFKTEICWCVCTMEFWNEEVNRYDFETVNGCRLFINQEIAMKKIKKEMLDDGYIELDLSDDKTFTIQDPRNKVLKFRKNGETTTLICGFYWMDIEDF
jgi:hypothetical protein